MDSNWANCSPKILLGISYALFQERDRWHGWISYRSEPSWNWKSRVLQPLSPAREIAWSLKSNLSLCDSSRLHSAVALSKSMRMLVFRESNPPNIPRWWVSVSWFWWCFQGLGRKDGVEKLPDDWPMRYAVCWNAPGELGVYVDQNNEQLLRTVVSRPVLAHGYRLLPWDT